MSLPVERTSSAGASPDDELRARVALVRLEAAAAISEEDVIEAVYAEVHGLVEARDFGAIDALLRAFPVSKYANSVLLSILTATALGDVRSQLGWREDFLARTKACLTRREGAEALRDLLDGLW